MFRTIIVPLDGSEAAESAIPYAIEETRGHHATLILLRVVPRPEVLASGRRHGGPLPCEPAWSAAELAVAQRDAESYLERLVERFDLPADTHLLVTVGDPYTRILAEVDRRPGALVVVAIDGLSDPRRPPMAEVAQRLLRCSRAPVLGVRGSRSATSDLAPPVVPSTYGEAYVG